MCLGAGKEVEHMLTLLSALVKAVNGFSIAMLIITILSDKLATPGFCPKDPSNI
jgi:hypothetical protein